ncbi:iron(III) transport system ATP-binding protein [Actinokineospora alba]|uniref:ABC-type quaternary amine transporter n=1 Tax=Actinokineospora alba TaxID=504798 RepID=A0A1H0N5J6_9PSEU|nr:ABC transporter ATP-binding protein [Actinokineospora alba]TDP68576.1 iron(III) transport system ATP-binding protein [Actinokineospora alba]SDH82039.1 iron(III) transport system ATP-binding protein [Actinokineospora alba]SDO87881.1 iron(III) transport system ATP-binding protein [Actinokineospora alba]
MTELTITGLTAGYGATRVLRGVDLTVPSGSLAAVLGPSGCGKTTLLRVVAGFLRPAAGEVRLGGRVVTSLAPERRRATVVPQEGALFPHLTVGANVGYGLPRPGRAERVAEMLQLIGLAGFEKRKPAELSGGQQQRVALARALAPAPDLVLLDEPFSALDAGLRADLRADVRRVLRAAGTTALLVTHDQDEALSMADVVAVMRDGGVVQAGSPEDVYSRPVDLGVATFVGEAVLLPAVASGGSATSALGVIDLTAEATGSGTVLLRPEQVSPNLDGEGITAKVLRTSFHGHDATVTLRAGDTELVSRVPAPLRIAEGDNVRIRVSGQGRFYPAAMKDTRPSHDS